MSHSISKLYFKETLFHSTFCLHWHMKTTEDANTEEKKSKSCFNVQIHFPTLLQEDHCDASIYKISSMFYLLSTVMYHNGLMVIIGKIQILMQTVRGRVVSPETSCYRKSFIDLFLLSTSIFTRGFFFLFSEFPIGDRIQPDPLKKKH